MRKWQFLKIGNTKNLPAIQTSEEYPQGKSLIRLCAFILKIWTPLLPSLKLIPQVITKGHDTLRDIILKVVFKT